MENIKNMIDVNTIVGDPVEAKDGSLIIPISKVSFGFASGGSEFNTCLNTDNAKYPFGGGSGAGVSVKPVAFLVIKSDSVRLLPLEQNGSYDKLIDSFPQIIDTLKGLVNEDSSKKNEKNQCKSNESPHIN